MPFYKGHKDLVPKESRKRSASKISSALKGKKKSVTYRQKMSEAQKGKPTWWMKRGLSNPMKGVKMSENINHRKAMAKLKGVKRPPLSKEHKAKLSLAKIGKTGQFSNHWKGGLTPLVALVRQCFQYRQWRSDVFTNDNFTCVWCGQRGGELEADHIESFSYLFYKNNIKSLEEALSCDELWNINNGRTLCAECHKKTDTYKGKSAKRNKLGRFESKYEI